SSPRYCRRRAARGSYRGRAGACCRRAAPDRGERRAARSARPPPAPRSPPSRFSSACSLTPSPPRDRVASTLAHRAPAPPAGAARTIAALAFAFGRARYHRLGRRRGGGEGRAFIAHARGRALAHGRAPARGLGRRRGRCRRRLARLLLRLDARRLLLRLADRHAHDVGGVPAVEIGDRLRELGFERRALLRRQRAGREAFLLTAAPVAPAAASPASPAPSALAVGLVGALGCGRAEVRLLRVVGTVGLVPGGPRLDAPAVLGRRVIAILLVAVAAFAAAAAAPPPPAAAAPLTGLAALLAGRRAVGMRAFELAVVAGKLRRLGFIRLERFLFVGE